MTHERGPVGEEPAAFEQHAQQIEQTPPGDEVVLACAADIQLDVSPTEDELKRDLWTGLIDGYRNADISQSAMARRVGISPGSLANFEKRGVDSARLSTLEQYAERLSGWQEEIGSPISRKYSDRQRRRALSEPEAYAETHTALTLISSFDLPLFQRLIAEGGTGYISPEAFSAEQEEFARAHGRKSLDLRSYHDIVAQPRLHDQLVGAAAEARRGIDLSAGLTRMLTASASIAQALQALLAARHDQAE